MLNFHVPTTEDKANVDAIFSVCACPTLEYNFTTIYIWRQIFETEICTEEGIFYCKSGLKKTSFLFPAGAGDMRAALEKLDAYAKDNGIALRFHSLSAMQKDTLETLWPGRFEFREVRDAGDYIYDADSLRTLKGKKLAAKRNHINRFWENHPDWTYERIDTDNIDEVKKMHNDWCALSACEEDKSLAQETCAVRCALKNFSALKLDGGLIRTGGKVIAFSIGDRLNESTYLVHIEKAFADIQGAYPMINQQFVLHNADGYMYINREDDAGDEGLRKAKLSYRPIEIAVKFVATEK